jgi:hypothetical protein
MALGLAAWLVARLAVLPGAPGGANGFCRGCLAGSVLVAAGGQHSWALILGEVLQQTVRPLVVRRCNRCWDVVPRVGWGEQLTISTLGVSSALLVLSERARGGL